MIEMNLILSSEESELDELDEDESDGEPRGILISFYYKSRIRNSKNKIIQLRININKIIIKKYNGLISVVEECRTELS